MTFPIQRYVLRSGADRKNKTPPFWSDQAVSMRHLTGLAWIGRGFFALHFPLLISF